MMQKDSPHVLATALAYLVDCQLATACRVVGKRSSTQYDIRRHIAIPQNGVDWLREYGVNFASTRADDVVRLFGGCVEAWAEKFKA